MVSVSIIIPTYNEAKNLPLLVEEIFSSLDKNKIDAELIIVDDNSPDGTGAVAEELMKINPLKVVRRAGKMGLGSAVIRGFKESNRQYLGVMDADLSHDPAILNNLVASLEQYDIVTGSRFSSGSRVENWPASRKLLSHIGVYLARFLTGVKDPLSGYFFLRRSVIEDIQLTATGYKILFEILAKGRYQQVKEIPFNFRMRQFSSSKLNWREYWLFGRQLLEYGWSELKNF